MRLCVVCSCRLMFDDMRCVLLFLLVVGMVRCVLLFGGCCSLSVVVLRGMLFVFGMRCCLSFVVCWLLSVVVGAMLSFDGIVA